jgi:DNA-binding MarR family transcriptional regulator
LSIKVSEDSVVGLAQELTSELFELSIALDLIGNAAASRAGMNQTDLICLNLLVRHGPLSPGQIAASLGLTTAAISAMATRLEAGGYAIREIDPKDRRRVLMYASPAGTQQAFSLFDDFYRAALDLFSSADEQDIKKVTDMLTQFRRILAEHAATIRAQPKMD